MKQGLYIKEIHSSDSYSLKSAISTQTIREDLERPIESIEIIPSANTPIGFVSANVIFCDQKEWMFYRFFAISLEIR